MDRLPLDKQVGRVITCKRKSMGLERKELSKVLGVPYNTIVALENGARRPNEEFIEDFDRLFVMSHDRAKIFPIENIKDFIIKPELSIEEKAFINIFLLSAPLGDMAAYLEDRENEFLNIEPEENLENET